MKKYVLLFALYLVILAVAGSAEAEDWPVFMRDRRRTGVTCERLELPLKEAWVFTAIHPPEPAWPPPAKQDFWHHYYNLRPAVTYDRAFHVVGTGDMICFGSSADDKVCALDALTGQQRWTFFAEGPIRLAPTIWDNKVYIGSDDGYVYCLRADNGSLMWKYKAADGDRMIPGNGRMISIWPVRAGLLVDGGNVYFAAGLFPNQGTFLFALSAQDGSLRWKQKVNASPQGYIVASDERLYVPTGRTNPVIFARADGSFLGELPSAGGTFVLLTENVFVSGPGRGPKELYAADVDSTDKIATFAGLAMVVNGTTAYMQAEKQLSAFDRGAYLELSRRQNNLKKQYDEVKGQLKKTDTNTAKAQQLQQQVQRITIQLSELSRKLKDCYLWTVECEYPYSMIMAGDVLFAGGENTVAAIETENGRVIWRASVEGRAFGLSVVNGGLYVSTDKGRIHCFRNDTKDCTRAITPTIDISPYAQDYLTQLYAEAADCIVERTGVTKGYCLVLGCGQGRLAYELARRSDLKIIGVEQDIANVAAARNAIDRAGLYGRVVVHHSDPESLAYTKYFANLIVSDETLRTGKLPASADQIYKLLRPYGGTVAFAQSRSQFNREKLQQWGRPALVDWQVYDTSEIILACAKRKELKGAGEWTHTYAEPGNTACSRDILVKGNMTVQWFGQPGPRDMIDRHHRNVSPLFKDGRLFVPGDCVVFAVDAYNGTIEWKIEVPNSRRLGVFLDCGSMAVDDKFLYVVTDDKCYGLDVQTGKCNTAYEMPQLLKSEARDWGYIAYFGDVLLGSGRRKGASYTETNYEADKALWHRNMKLVVSDYLFAVEKGTGQPLWKYKGGLILNTTIAVGDGRVYFLETYSPKALANILGRMSVKTLFDGGDQYLVALDCHTGQIVFKRKVDVSNLEEPVYLNYANDTLLLSGSRLIGDSIRYYYCAFDASHGTLKWKTDHDSGLAKDGGHGEYNRHPTIVGDTVYAWPYAYNLRTGRRTEGWRFDRRGHGCGGVSASAQCLFWRGGNPWMYDLGPNGAAQRLNRVTRPGCWINIIPAGGLVLIPESSSGCTCGFALQSSMAFVPE